MHFLATNDWLEFQKSLGRKTWRFDGLFSANVIKHDIVFGKNYLYVPRGPVLNAGEMTVTDALNQEEHIKSELISLGKDIKKRAFSEHSLYIKVEPGSDFVAKSLVEAGFQRSKKQIQPPRTTVVDLAAGEDELWKKLSHGTQYNIKFAQKRNVIVREEPAERFERVWDIFRNTAKRDAFHLHKKEYYQKLLAYSTDDLRTSLFVAYAKLSGADTESPIAAALVLFYRKETAYYLHAASSAEHQKLKPAFILNWEIMRYAKKKGYGAYDLYGIDPKKMPGVSKFKLSFRGRVVEYPGAFDLPVSKFWYFWYRLFSKK